MSQTMVLNKMGEAIGMNGKYQPSKLRDRCAWPNPDYAHFEEALAIVQEKFVPLNRSHAALYPGDEVRQRFFVLEYAHVLGHLVVASHLESFKDFKLGKETLLCAIQDYPARQCFPTVLIFTVTFSPRLQGSPIMLFCFLAFL